MSSRLVFGFYFFILLSYELELTCILILETEVSGAQYYYYYTTDSAEAIQFSLAPTGFNSTTPTTIQFNSEVVISYTYFGIEDSNYATPGQSGSEFSSNGGGSGSLAAITEGNGQDMFDSSDSYDGASMSSQASIWTYDENFVLGAQFWNFNTSSTDGAANNVSIILFEANYDLGQGYSFIAVQGDGEMVEGNGVEVVRFLFPSSRNDDVCWLFLLSIR